MTGAAGAVEAGPTADVRPPLARTARLFVALWIINLALRGLIWLAQLLFTTDGGQPQESVFQLDDLLILLPVLVLRRRRTAAGDTTRVVWAAAALASGTFIVGPIGGLVGLSTDGFFPDTKAEVVRGLFLVAGWLLMAMALAPLNPRRPAGLARGAAAVAAGGMIAAAVIAAVSNVTYMVIHTPLLEGACQADPCFLNFNWTDSLLVLGAGVAIQLALAAFGWVVGRSLDDPRRPRLATRLAVISIVVSATLALVGAILVGIEDLTGWPGLGAGAAPIFLYSGEAAFVLLLGAFATGLTDGRPLDDTSTS